RTSAIRTATAMAGTDTTADTGRAAIRTTAARGFQIIERATASRVAASLLALCAFSRTEPRRAENREQAGGYTQTCGPLTTGAARWIIRDRMTREQLARRIADVSLLRGEFTLRSGRKSNYYLDKYRFETQP